MGLTILTGAFLMSGDSATYADSATATVTVGSACTLTATVNTAHTAEVPAGSSQTEIGSTTLKTICNDAGGFAIYAVGYTNNEFGNNKMSNGTTEFNTGTGSSASNWNMSLSQVTTGTYATTIDGGFGSYSAIPATYTKVAHMDSVTDAVASANATGSSIDLTYGAYISSTQATGDYVGKVKFTLVHPATEIPAQPQTTQANKICYYANASTYEGTMGCQTISSSATSATLLASNFSRTGYGFAGWSDAYDYATNASANFYGPQEYIIFTAGQYSETNKGLSLYAVWVKSAGSIQSWNGCSSLTAADQATNIFSQSITALTDQRDSQTYAVAKLADGQCWMIENLRLESTNSDNSTGALAQGYGTSATYGDFAGLADAESANFTADSSSATAATTANSLYYAGTQSGTATIDISQTRYAGSRMPRYNNTNTSARASSPTTNSSAMYSYGNYYTWAAAMANTGYYNTTIMTDGYTPSEAANTSLCPTGWRLPYGRNTANSKGTTAGGFSYLDTQLGGTGASSDSSTTPTGDAMSKAWRAFPNNFLYSGYFDTSSANVRGSSGNYWSSTAGNNVTSYYLYLYSSYMTPGTGSVNKYYGNSIRCVSGS